MTTPEEYKRSLAGLDADIAAQATTIPPPSVQDDDDADKNAGDDDTVRTFPDVLDKGVSEDDRNAPTVPAHAAVAFLAQ